MATAVEEPERESQVPRRTADEEMQFHFWDVAEARDAVIRADLEAVRAPLLRIAEGQYGEDMPTDWRTWIEDMQSQAREGARVTTLADAAKTVANLSAACADCHRATNAGPELVESVITYRPHSEGLSERMQQHKWASDALWAGLTAPQHQAWSRGSRALAELPLPEKNAASEQTELAAEKQGEMEVPEAATTSSPFAQKLDAIRALGERADAAAQPNEKAAVYAEILTHCSGCHAKMRGY